LSPPLFFYFALVNGMNSDALNSFIQILERQTGLKISDHHLKLLQKWIPERLTGLGFKTVQSYCDWLTCVALGQMSEKSLSRASADAEWQRLINQITTGESYFWRDHGQVHVLREHILPALIQAKRDARQQGQPQQLSLRLWSAGCSTGEEAYTLAILLQSLIPDIHQWNILVLGTDLNPAAIAKAKQGTYKQWSFRQTPEHFQSQYFKPVSEGWRVIPKIHAMPTFQSGNLLQDSFPAIHSNLFQMDLILCRNVFIYFYPEGIAHVLQKFYETLLPGGYLMSGHSELQAQDLSSFQILSFPQSMIYRRPSPSQDSAIAAVQVLPSRGITRPRTPANQSLSQPTLVPMVSMPGPSSLPAPLANHTTPPRSLTRPDASTPEPTSLPVKSLQNHSPGLTELSSRQGNHEAQFKMAQIYADQGQYQQAVQACEMILESAPEWLAPLYLLAQISEEQGDFKQAKSILKKIIYLSPEAVAAYIELGGLYLHEQQPHQAYKLFCSARAVLQNMPPNTELDYQGTVRAHSLMQYVDQLSLDASPFR
jgi:chemotaxis protein methyltransferase CheR